MFNSNIGFRKSTSYPSNLASLWKRQRLGVPPPTLFSRTSLAEWRRAKTTNSRRTFLWTVILVGFAVTLLLASYRTFFHKDWKLEEYIGPVQYALMIDAGSSGSRLYAYHWRPPESQLSLPRIKPFVDSRGDPISMKISPGLSSFGDSPSEAVEHMSTLLDYAETIVPKEQHSHTPLFILATAGMRLIPVEKQAAIIRALVDAIPEKYEFGFNNKSVEIISGAQEGVFQWLAINYALGRLETSQPTVGILDLGGGSFQVAFEVGASSALTYGQDVTNFNLTLGRTYHVYSKTFLGYGANEKFTHHREDLVAKTVEKYGSNSSHSLLPGLSSSRPIRDPCLPMNFDASVELETSEFLNNTVEKQWYFRGSGDWTRCRASLRALVEKPRRANKACLVRKPPTCDPWPPLIQPPVNLLADFFYGFSEFWYSTEDIFRLGGHYVRDKVRKAGSDYCRTDWKMLMSRFTRDLYPLADLARLQTQCFKSAWILTVLHDGLKFPTYFTNLHTSSYKVGGHSVAWTLGAILYKSMGALPEGHHHDKDEEHEIGFHVHDETSVYLNPQSIILLFCILTVIGATALVLCRLRRSPYRLLPAASDLGGDIETGWR